MQEATPQQSANLAQLQQARFGSRAKPQSSPAAQRLKNRFAGAAQKMLGLQDTSFKPNQQPSEAPSDKVIDDPIARRAQLARATALAQQERLDEIGQQEEQTQQEEEAKQALRGSMRRGMAHSANAFAGAIDATGIGFLFGFFVHVAAFGELVTEMVYGRWIAKGKSKIVPPISWDPIPLSMVDPHAIILQIFLFVCVLGLAVAALTIGFFSFCALSDLVTFLASPIRTAVGLAAGSNNMCLGGIISSIFGL